MVEVPAEVRSARLPPGSGELGLLNPELRRATDGVVTMP